jgi:hypothetical protein
MDSASNRNEYQASSWGVKSDRCVRLTTSMPSVSRFSRKCGSPCYRDSFTFFLYNLTISAAALNIQRRPPTGSVSCNKLYNSDMQRTTELQLYLFFLTAWSWNSPALAYFVNDVQKRKFSYPVFKTYPEMMPWYNQGLMPVSRRRYVSCSRDVRAASSDCSNYKSTISMLLYFINVFTVNSLFI